MADADAAPPTPPRERVATEEHPAAAATAEADNKRKLEEVSTDAEVNGNGEDAKRPHVDDEPDAAAKGVDQHKDGSSVPAAAEDKVAPTPIDGAAMDGGNNGTAAPAPDSQAGSDEKPLAAAAEAPQQEGDAKAAAAQDDIICRKKIQVPSNKIGVLTGKAGEIFRNMQISSGATMQITRNSDVHSPNPPTVSVELVGSLASVDKAEQLMKSVMAEAEADEARGSGQNGSGKFEMTVPVDKVGLIIGRRGVMIRDLQLESGARILLVSQRRTEGVMTFTGRVEITGRKEQIEVARELIQRAMDQTFPNQSRGYSGPRGYRRQGRRAGSRWGPPHSQDHN